MKLRKLLLSSLAVGAILIATGCGGSGSDAKTIRILSLKPEIDAQFQAYAKAYSEKNGVKVEVETCGGDNCKYADKLDSLITAGNMPDIIVFEGNDGYTKYKDRLVDLSDQAWVKDTDLAFKSEGKVYGFPSAVEGYGLTYNKDILDKAGIDPATLTSRAAYEKAFATLEAKKSELGIVAPLSMAAGTDMRWVTGLHAFNSYLSAELKYDDKSIVDKLNAGSVDDARMTEYANMIELYFKYSDKTVLTKAGNVYDENVKLFTDQKVAFLHQGNWVDGNVTDAGLKNVGIAPSAYGKANTVFISAPSYFGVNKDSKSLDTAKKFLTDIQATPEGNKFMYTDAKAISPFKSVKVEPTTPLAKSIYTQLQTGTQEAWNQYQMPADFGMTKLGPIHELYAKGDIDKAKFVEQLKAEIAKLK